jgi:iron complex outermembrane receptor protein
MHSRKNKILKKHFSQSAQRKPKTFRINRFSLRAQANNVSGREFFFEFLRDHQPFDNFEGGNMHRKERVGAGACALALILVPCATGAQEPEKMETVVVTATRTEKDIESAPGSVSVITKEEMAKRNIITVDDALNTTTGVHYSRGKGMMDRMSSITLRGIPGQSRTLILLDGIAMNSPYSGSFLSVGVAPGSLERIEVVKGGASSLYGGYAMAGVVNMITRMPEKREFTLQGGFGSALEGRAPENSRRVAFSYGDRIADKLRLYIHNDYLATDGYRSDLNTQSKEPTGLSGWSETTDTTGTKKYYVIGDKGKNGAWQDNLTVKSEYAFTPETKLRFTFYKSIGEYDYDDPQTYLRDSSDNRVWSYGTVKEGTFLGGNGGSDQHVYNLTLDTELLGTKAKMQFGYMDQLSSWGVTPTSSSATRDGGSGKYSDTPAAAWNVDLQFTTPLFWQQILTWGGSFRTGWAHSREYALSDWRDEDSRNGMTYESKGSDRTFALFMQDEIPLLENLTLFAGFRQDWWRTFDGYANQVGSSGYPQSYSSRGASSFSPKGAIVYKPLEKTIIKISGGKSFRAPTVYDLYRTWTSSSGITYASNPKLKPEKNLSWDASVEQKLWSGATFKATYFENYISDLIYSSTDPLDPKRRNKLNAGSGESKGVELEAEQRFGKLLRLFANYTYTDAEITKNRAVPDSEGKRMTDVPKIMYNAGADLEYGPFGASAIARYVGKRYASDTNADSARHVPGVYDSYITTDVKLQYRVTRWATASFSVNNLFDEKYYSYSRAPGRSCYGELTLRY